MFSISSLFNRSRHSSLTSELKDFNAHLLQGAREMPQLKLWQLQGNVEGQTVMHECVCRLLVLHNITGHA